MYLKINEQGSCKGQKTVIAIPKFNNIKKLEKIK